MEHVQKCILIVDDDPDIFEAARAVLESAGYKVMWATNGEDGIRTARESKPDLIILDVMMRTFTEGFRVGYELKKDPALKSIPVIFLSAIAEKSGMRFSKEEDQEYLPGELFLEKPFDPEDLLKKVSELIGKRK